MLITKPGILSTVQDLGRTGHRALGINPGGVMDHAAARIANILLGNDENEAVLEMHFPAAEIVFEAECGFALAGADLGATLNEVPIRSWASRTATEGDVLRFADKRFGNRAYLAVSGGFDVEDWLGSRSTNLAAAAGGFHGRALKAGDRLGLKAPRPVKRRTAGPSIIPRYSRFPTVRVVAGGEFDRLTAVGERTFLESAFTVTHGSDRMGFRLAGEPVYTIDDVQLVSSAVAFGTIQLLPDGQLIVLMADHQTSGGYPRLANVVSADLPLLAQLGPGDGVSFHIVPVENAERAAAAFERELCILRLGVTLTA